VHAEIDGRRATDGELVSIVELLIIAGNETTTNALTSAMRRLIAEPDLEEMLRAERSLLPNFVEEVLRYEAPIQGLFRKVTKDVVLGGVDIAADSILVIRYGAGNRDPKVFADADIFDVRRTNARSHLAFSYGLHFCLGNHLARSELRIVYDRLLSRACNFRLAPEADAVHRLASYITYGVTQLNIEFDKI
jgi:cytochrome P450